MIEADWLTCTDPTEMLHFLFKKWSERKRRLFECACCRQVWDQLTDARSQAAVEVAERFADGLVTDADLETAANAASDACDWSFLNDLPHSIGEYPFEFAAYNVAIPMGWWGGAPAFESPSSILTERLPEQRLSQCTLARCIAGNPFTPAHFDPSFRTSTVVALATQAYDTRDFAIMPILADALSDAGVPDDSEILRHCRGGGPHCRGCHVLDSILGRC